MRDPLYPIKTSVELGVCGSIMRCTHVQITLSPSPRLSNFLGKVFFLKQLKRSIRSMRYGLNLVSHCNRRAACFMPRGIGLLNDSPISQPKCAIKDD